MVESKIYNSLSEYESVCKSECSGKSSEALVSVVKLPIENVPFWGAVGRVGCFAWRAMGIYFSEKEQLSDEQYKYNQDYLNKAKDGCVHSAFEVMRYLEFDPEFNELVSNSTFGEIVIGNTPILHQGRNDFVVINEFYHTLQQNMTFVDADVFQVDFDNPNTPSLSINKDAVKDKHIILPFLFSNQYVLKYYSEIAKGLILSGAKTVLAIYFVHLMPNKYGEIPSKVDLPRPTGGMSFRDLMNGM